MSEEQEQRQSPVPPTGEARARVLVIAPPGTFTTATLRYEAAMARTPRQTVVGTTAHLVVYSDGTAQGNAAAQAVLRTAEADYSAVTAWFGGLSLPAGVEGDDTTTPRTATPIHVLIDPQAGGAYHFSCAGTDLYIEPQDAIASGLMVAELVEVFEAAIDNGWACGNTNGEALSRALAVERNAGLGPLVAQTAQTWWANGQVDYVTTNDATDRNQDANGCGTLFLYYLRYQLGYDWQTIVTTGGATLGKTYQQLTNQPGDQGFQAFLQTLATRATNGQLDVPQSGNPFPLAGATAGGADTGATPDTSSSTDATGDA